MPDQDTISEPAEAATSAPDSGQSQTQALAAPPESTPSVSSGIDTTIPPPPQDIPAPETTPQQEPILDADDELAAIGREVMAEMLAEKAEQAKAQASQPEAGTEPKDEHVQTGEQQQSPADQIHPEMARFLNERGYGAMIGSLPPEKLEQLANNLYASEQQVAAERQQMQEAWQQQQQQQQQQQPGQQQDPQQQMPVPWQRDPGEASPWHKYLNERLPRDEFETDAEYANYRQTAAIRYDFGEFARQQAEIMGQLVQQAAENKKALAAFTERYEKTESSQLKEHYAARIKEAEATLSQEFPDIFTNDEVRQKVYETAAYLSRSPDCVGESGRTDVSKALRMACQQHGYSGLSARAKAEQKKQLARDAVAASAHRADARVTPTRSGGETEEEIANEVWREMKEKGYKLPDLPERVI